jgi:protein-tyrosine phosphatase
MQLNLPGGPADEPIRLIGTDNFRSLKGMAADGGRLIAGHTLLRSAQLHRLQAADWQLLSSLGLRTVCDLRSGGERQRYPSQLPGRGLRQLVLEVSGDIRADPRVAAMLAERPAGEGARGMMLEIYRRFPDMLAGHLPALFGLFESGEVPVLIHCAAGKDRTGFVVALLLHALGVAPDDIMADYCLSARRFAELGSERREEMARAVSALIDNRVDEAALDAVLDARPEYLRASFTAIEERFGSLEGYLERCAGLDPARLARLRERCLTAG